MNNDSNHNASNNASHTSKLQQWLENIWYNDASGKIFLLPLTGIYCAINSFQRWKYRNYHPKIPCPVIVVGNISVGGTGKTPLTIHLVKLLQKAGYKPAIITRGYGGKATSWPQSVTAESDPHLVGDEAVLMALNTKVPVYAGADRLLSIKQLTKDYNCDVIVSDDGLQHYQLPRDIQIAVIDGARMLGNGWCLPAGPLRERKQRLDACDMLVINGEINQNKSDDNAINQWFGMNLKGSLLVNLLSNEKKPLEEFTGKNVHAITGIGNPQRFFKVLEQGGLQLETHSFPDHYDFKADDLQFDNDLPIVMTEKDAVKCRKFAKQHYWYLPVSAELDNDFDESILKLLE